MSDHEEKSGAAPGVVVVPGLDEFVQLKSNWTELTEKVAAATKTAQADLAAEKSKSSNPNKFNPQNMQRLETETRLLLTEGQTKLDEMFNGACDLWEKTVKPSLDEHMKTFAAQAARGDALAQQQLAACEAMIEANEKELYG